MDTTWRWRFDHHLDNVDVNKGVPRRAAWRQWAHWAFEDVNSWSDTPHLPPLLCLVERPHCAALQHLVLFRINHHLLISLRDDDVVEVSRNLESALFAI